MMPTTITSYVTFAPNTKARATEVNNNFSNHRGNLLPINTDTATASNSTHNLGDTSHRWKNLHVSNIKIEGSTSTTLLEFGADTSSTIGGWSIFVGTTTAKCLDWTSETSYLLNYGATAASFNAGSVDFIVNSLTSASFKTASINFFLSGLTVAAFSANGLKRASLEPETGFTSSSNTGVLSFNTTVASTIPALVLTMSAASSSDLFEIGLFMAQTIASFGVTGATSGAFVFADIGLTQVYRSFIGNQTQVGTVPPGAFRTFIQPGTVGSFDINWRANNSAGSETGTDFSYISAFIRRV